MFDEAELKRMSAKERAKLMRALAALDMPALANPGNRRRRRWFLISTIVCCVVLAAWIGVLIVTLPRYYRAGDWRGAWVGFDLAELITFAVTAWAAWRGRQVLMHDDLDPQVAAALARAHNNWTRDFCATDSNRLKFAAQLAFHDVPSALPGLLHARKVQRRAAAVRRR